MPTPFTHLWIAERLLQDSKLPEHVAQLIHAEKPAFLLGSIVADAKPSSNAGRDVTHFYRYDQEMQDHPWRLMLQQHPTLAQSQDSAHRAFIAGYVAHLATDEYWSLYMLQPNFAMGEWGDSLRWRFFVLHLLLIYMDERDAGRLSPWHAAVLSQAQPIRWLPFMPDSVCIGWRDYIAHQIQSHDSDTLEIFGQRVGRSADELRQMLDSADTMQSMLWDHVPLSLVEKIEEDLYQFSVLQLCDYMADSVYR